MFRYFLHLPLVLAISAVTTFSCAASTRVFNVRDFGALGDGKALDSPSINRAIDAAVAAGGGTVLLPEGRYLSGTIRMQSDVHLKIDQGAVLVADRWNSMSYDPTEPFTPPAWQDGGHCYFHNSLIRGENLRNVTISGTGLIDGSGLTSWQGDLNRKVGFGAGSEGFKPGTPVNPDEPTYAANKAIAFKLCQNVTIRDISILKGGWFAILVTGCDHVLLENLTIDTNRDGIDIDCCHHVVVRGCRVNSPMDDAICPKSTHVLGYPRLTENLLIENCQVSGFKIGTLLDGTMQPDPKNHRNGRIKFGTESSGGFRNVTIANCTFRCSMGLARQSVDGGILENFTIPNITMTDVRKYGIYVTLGNRNRTPGVTTPSCMRNVRISNVVMDGVEKMAGIILTGLPEQSIENLRLENIRMTTKGGGTRKDAEKTIPEAGGYPKATWAGDLSAYGIFARHIKGLELADIAIDFDKPEMRPAARFENIEGLRIDHFKARVSEGVETAVFTADVRDATVICSPAIRHRQ